MFRHVPNIITAARLVLAFVFFGLLSWYQFEGRGSPVVLNIAFIVYAIALFSDFLDGYLARKWKVEGAFGRIVDPFVDKVLVLGSFIFFAGKNFVIPDFEMMKQTEHSAFVVKTITGITPLMVVIILARELLVTAFRSMGEQSGQAFGAQFAGKLKMVFQSITILVILVYVNYFVPYGTNPTVLTYATYVRDFFIWTTILITVLSGLSYVRGAIKVARGA